MPDPKQIYRYEWKYLISLPEAELLRRRLLSVLHPDSHAGPDGGYEIRSLYFDDWRSSAYEQKMMGVYARKKWRIRVYNCSDRVISLERKKKRGNYIYKESAKLTREELDKILAGDYGFLLRKGNNLCGEFYTECVTELLRPKVIVDYHRIPLILKEGTVRVTFDSDVRAAVGGFQLFDPTLPVISAMPPDVLVLEVKYTAFLPRLVQQLLPTDAREFVAFSKYTACWDAAHHLTDVTAGLTKTMNGWRISP